MGAILDGVRILDLTNVVMGPLSTQTLGDMGADVVKVESPAGDITRQSHPGRSPSMGQNFLNLNRNKRSIAIDLKHPDGRAALLALAGGSDVLVYNMRPQAMARLRLTYEDFAAVNPRIIYVGAFGFSQRGPYAAHPAYDDVIQGLGGLPWLYGTSTGGEPRYFPMAIVDRSVAAHLTVAILGALLYRERTGQGQRVDVPMFEHLSAVVLAEHFEGATFVPAIGRMGHARSLSTERHPYRTGDGHICVMVYTDAQWQRFLAMIGQADLFTTDARFSSYKNRLKNADHVFGFLADVLRTRSTADWLRAFAENDVPAGPMHSLEQLLDDAHLAAIGHVQEIDHTTEGRLRTIPYPTEWSESPATCRQEPPRLGEHTVELLQAAGVARSDIDRLLEAGAVKAAPPASATTEPAAPQRQAASGRTKN